MLISMANPNPQRLELTDPKAYLQRMIDQTAGRDPLVILAETPRTLAEIAGRHPADVLRRRPYEGKWTPTEVLGHLLDTELVFGYRIRTIFADDSPQIIGMDQDKWVAAQRYNERDAAEIIAHIAAVRPINLAMYRLIRPEHHDRVGLHSERGPEKLGDILKYAAGHDLWHIDQFRRYAEAAAGM